MSATESTESAPNHVWGLLPGVLLCVAIGAAARALQWIEESTLHHPYVEALVMAILLGTLVRSLWLPSPRFRPGITFAAKDILEVAVALLGLSVDAPALMRAGVAFPLAIATVVALTLLLSFWLARALGLRRELAILISCGNAICGNSAIAAVAPVVGAEADDVAAAIAITAAMGVAVVVWLPSLVPLFGLSATQYGVVAGLTVYAVPQVLAATVPMGAAAVQMGTLVKLLRVLLLGPLVAALAYLENRAHRARGTGSDSARRPLLPWFIAAFVLLAAVRATGIVPTGLITGTREFATTLTILSMAALGLGVDVRALTRVGGPVTLAVAGSLLLLGTLSIAVVRLLNLG